MNYVWSWRMFSARASVLLVTQLNLFTIKLRAKTKK